MTDHATTKGSALSTIGLGARMMLKHPSKTATFLILSLIQGALQGAFIWVLREILIIYSEADSLDMRLVMVSAIGVFVVWLIRSANVYLAQLASIKLAQRIMVDMILSVVAKMLSLPVRFFMEHSHGRLIFAAFQDVARLRAIVVDVGQMVLHAFTLLGLSITALVLSPKLALIGYIAVPLGILPAYRLGLLITRAATQEREVKISFHDLFLELAEAIPLIKVNRAEELIYERTEEIGEEVYHYSVDKFRNARLSTFLLEAILGLGLILLLVVGGIDVAAGRLEWQSLLGILIAVMAVYTPIKALLSIYNNLRANIPSMDAIEAIMSEPLDIYHDEDALALEHPPGTIELKNVTFGYNGMSVLRGISATFHQGETIGIVGHSGAGKSTLISLLMRFFDPSEGTILFDGEDLRDIRYGDLMDKCAIVLQEPFLFFDTIANNIKMGRQDATVEEIVEAAKAANIHDEIMAMEKGYETVLGQGESRGETGRGISVGQKQRINIAAALLKNAPILFLDEATSNLDAVSERKVQQAIDRLMTGRTTFVIAHRLSTLRDADRLLVLDAGEVVGIGTHSELLATNSIYHELWTHQHGAFVDGQPAADVVDEVPRARDASVADSE